MRPSTEVLFGSDLWTRALERYGGNTRLSVMLFDGEGRRVLGPVHPTPLFQALQERDYDPGIFAECARQCLSQTESRPAVLVSEIYGVATVGTSLALGGAIVGAAVAGYALVDFSQASEVKQLARDAGIPFDRLWQVTRAQKPVPRQRLLLSGELLQVLGDALLSENYRTRQYQQAVLELRAAVTAQQLTYEELERTMSELRDSEAELRAHAEELTRFNRVAVGRELRMIHLKREINDFCRRGGEAARYPLDFDREDTGVSG